MKPGLTSARCVAQQIPLRRAQSGAQRDGPERGTPDAKHHHIGERVVTRAGTGASGVRECLLVQRLVSRKLQKTKSAAGSLGFDRRMCRTESCPDVAPLAVSHSAVDRRVHHVRVIEAQCHSFRHTVMDSPSNAGATPAGSSASSSA